MNTKANVRTKTYQVILFASLVLLSIGLAGIFSRFEGIIVVKLGIEGGQIVIDGRRDLTLPKVLPKVLPENR